MKNVKITILKTTLDAELAAQYGVPGLTACPMMREGQVFYADYAKPEDSATKRGRQSISTSSPWLTATARPCFITATGSLSPTSPFAAATTACARSS